MLGREWVIGSIRTDYRGYCRDCYTTSFATMPVIHHALHGSETLGGHEFGGGDPSGFGTLRVQDTFSEITCVEPK